MNTDNKFRLTEKRLFQYGTNIKKLVTLQAELAALKSKGDIHAQGYNSSASNNTGINNPVLNYVERVLRLESKIKRFEHDITPVTRLINDLQRNKSKKARDFIILIREFYSNKHSLKEIAETTKKTRQTLYRRRVELVGKASSYF